MEDIKDIKECLLDLEVRVALVEDKVKENEASNSFLQGFTRGISDKFSDLVKKITSEEKF